MTDYSSAYRDLRARVLDLLRSRDAVDLDATARATPEWRVRDVVAHLAGVCDDVAHGNLEGVATDEWTGAQVEKRRGWEPETLFADWETNGAAVEAMMNDFPAIAIGQMTFDATTHEQDIRGALTAPGGRESGSLAIAYDWAVDRLGERLDAAGTSPMRFETEAGSRVAGAGEAGTALRASRFDVLRSMTGRRSVAQVEAFDWDGAPRAADLLLADFFVPPSDDLLE
ncbi:MAG TPA: maleylpyruvate isomerase N-terminal domain-containing protein [Acidimicrobiia bacterium]|nr:maleylpyruvate isomerase N-terminal domain-containing protein [Acidimicrobiia bacterium]